VEKLIAAGSNVNLAKTTDGASPILIADQHGHDPVVEHLIASRCNVDLALTTNGAKAILLAAQNGHAAVVGKLIAAQCNVNIPVTAGCTALSLATQNGHTRIVTMIHNYLHPCTVCKKYGHDATGCWINAENKLQAAAKMKSDAEAILKSKKSNKKAYVASSAAKDHPL
jgi:ankyrin repeat protein